MKYLVIFIITGLHFIFADFIVPPTPASPVYDETWVLSVEEKNRLESIIFGIENDTYHQIGIAILQSLQGRTIEEVWVTLARSWWIGQKWLDNGLLFLVVPSERATRIEVGRWLEWVMTDLLSKRIIDENLLPFFREDNYFEGFESTLRRITPLLTGEKVTLPAAPATIIDTLLPLLFWLSWGGFFLGSVFFEPSKAWWPGIIIGAFLWGVSMWMALSTLSALLVGMISSAGVLGGLDFAFSKGIIRAIKSRPHGGRWWGWFGGSGGGSWGGFGWGWFGWGGASWRW